MVHFFMAMLFCTPSQLGWDPTVRLVHSPSVSSYEPENGQYDYVVEDADGTQTIYRTLEVISFSDDYGNARKGLRVWKAIEVRDGAPHGEAVVLKDAWRYTDIEREGSKVRAVVVPDPAADNAWSDGEKDALKRGVCTILHHGDVIIRPDAPSNLANASAEEDEDHDLYADDLPTHLNDYLSTLPPQPEWLPQPPRWWTGPGELSDRRMHYRIVIKEVCTPMRLVRWQHAKVFPALAQICESKCSCPLSSKRD